MGAGQNEPILASILSKQKDWRAAVAEICAEAAYQVRSRRHKTWSFAMAYVSGHEGVSLADLTDKLDAELGTHGALVGVMVDSCRGHMTDGTRSRAKMGEGPGLLLMAVHLPEPHEVDSAAQSAKSFFVGKRELMEISQLVLRLQTRVRVRGADEPANQRAWRQYLGIPEVKEQMPQGILLFVDPLASKYTVQTVLAGLDMAIPLAVKFGGVAADLPPPLQRVAIAGRARTEGGPDSAGVVGIVLPPGVSLHSVVSPGTIRVGPELRVTLAEGQVVKEINDVSAAEAIASVGRDVGHLERFLIDRSGFLLGLEAPEGIDPERSKVYDDYWGSSAKPMTYAAMQKQASGHDWLVRSIEPLPGGAIVVRREDLKRVPPRVGPRWLRCQLHVKDTRWARGELRLMFQRYLGARMTLPQPTPKPFGAIVYACTSWAAASEEASEGEVGHTELGETLGNLIPVASIGTHGEVGPAGVTLGGLDMKRTMRLGHTASCAVLNYTS